MENRPSTEQSELSSPVPNNGSVVVNTDNTHINGSLKMSSAGEQAVVEVDAESSAKKQTAEEPDQARIWVKSVQDLQVTTEQGIEETCHDYVKEMNRNSEWKFEECPENIENVEKGMPVSPNFAQVWLTCDNSNMDVEGDVVAEEDPNAVAETSHEDNGENNYNHVMNDGWSSVVDSLNYHEPSKEGVRDKQILPIIQLPKMPVCLSDMKLEIVDDGDEVTELSTGRATIGGAMVKRPSNRSKKEPMKLILIPRAGKPDLKYDFVNNVLQPLTASATSKQPKNVPRKLKRILPAPPVDAAITNIKPGVDKSAQGVTPLSTASATIERVTRRRVDQPKVIPQRFCLIRPDPHIDTATSERVKTPVDRSEIMMTEPAKIFRIPAPPINTARTNLELGAENSVRNVRPNPVTISATGKIVMVKKPRGRPRKIKPGPENSLPLPLPMVHVEVVSQLGWNETEWKKPKLEPPEVIPESPCGTGLTNLKLDVDNTAQDRIPNPLTASAAGERVKRPVGRPRKNPLTTSTFCEMVKRPVGRPRKNPLPISASSENVKRSVGRPQRIRKIPAKLINTSPASPIDTTITSFNLDVDNSAQDVNPTPLTASASSERMKIPTGQPKIIPSVFSTTGKIVMVTKHLGHPNLPCHPPRVPLLGLDKTELKKPKVEPLEVVQIRPESPRDTAINYSQLDVDNSVQNVSPNPVTISAIGKIVMVKKPRGRPKKIKPGPKKHLPIPPPPVHVEVVSQLCSDETELKTSKEEPQGDAQIRSESLLETGKTTDAQDVTLFTDSGTVKKPRGRPKKIRRGPKKRVPFPPPSVHAVSVSQLGSDETELKNPKEELPGDAQIRSESLLETGKTTHAQDVTLFTDSGTVKKRRGRPRKVIQSPAAAPKVQQGVIPTVTRTYGRLEMVSRTVPLVNKPWCVSKKPELKKMKEEPGLNLEIKQEGTPTLEKPLSHPTTVIRRPTLPVYVKAAVTARDQNPGTLSASTNGEGERGRVTKTLLTTPCSVVLNATGITGKRKRGRPRKSLPPEAVYVPKIQSTGYVEDTLTGCIREIRRGRPRKYPSLPPEAVFVPKTQRSWAYITQQKRGRPRKQCTFLPAKSVTEEFYAVTMNFGSIDAV